MNREQALALPTWEWSSLIENYQAIEAERALNFLYSSTFGFNGGEGFQTFEGILMDKMHRLSNQGVKVSEDVGDAWDAFLTVSGI